MLIFKRKYSIHIQRNAAYFSLLFLIFLIASNGIFNIYFPELAEVKVNEAFFGRFFVIAHLFFLATFFTILGLGMVLAKIGYISYPSVKIGTEEIENYNAKYHANFSFPKIKRGYYFRLILSTFIPVVTVGIPHLIYPGIGQFFTYIFLGLGVVFMFGLFYGTVGKIMRQNNNLMAELFQHANQNIPDTKIQLVGQNFQGSLAKLGVAFNLNIGGMFKGHDLTLKYGVSGRSMGRGIRTFAKGGISLRLNDIPKINFSIVEKNPPLNKVKGISLNECFEKRFDLKGTTIEKLPEAFKRKLLESFRAVDLKIKDGMMNQSLVHTYFLPFYSAQGIILFLDFMLELSQDLKGR